MTTLHNMPEDIKNFLREHGPAPTGPLAAEHQVGVQLAISRVADLVMSTFEELSRQPSGRDSLWNAARAAHATPQLDVDADLVKTALDDRYHGKLNGVAKAAGIQTASVNQLVERVSGAALSIMGGLVAQNH
jgi:OOP family OmpA-OmpF porin